MGYHRFRQLFLALCLANPLATVAVAKVAAEEPAVMTAQGPAKVKNRPRKKKRPGTPGEKKKYYASLGLGRTLPEKIMRVRMPVRVAQAYTGFDEDGKTEDLGLELYAVGTALVIEYGLNDRISLQFVAPYVVKNELSMDAEVFEESSRYKQEYQKFTFAMAQLLQQNGVCSNTDECQQLIESGFALPSDTEVTLPTGESVTLKANVPLRSYADSLIKNAARPASGETGLGDIEIGALFDVYRTELQLFAVGVGLRIPTGKFTDVPVSKRPTGGGLTSFGLRLNYDLQAVPGLWLSFQNQSEVMVAKGKLKKSSLVDPDNLNEGDPTTAEAIAAGSDGQGNTQDYETKGVRNIGVLRADWGLTDIHSILQSVAIALAYKYDYKPEVFVGDKSQGPGSELHSASVNLKWDGLGMKPRLPINFEYEYEVPLSGKNVALAAYSSFYKFNLYLLF